MFLCIIFNNHLIFISKNVAVISCVPLVASALRASGHNCHDYTIKYLDFPKNVWLYRILFVFLPQKDK